MQSEKQTKVEEHKPHLIKEAVRIDHGLWPTIEEYHATDIWQPI